MTLREARAQATLCPTCQLKSGYPPFHLRQSRYRAGNRTLAHLYTVPVLNDLDNIRNCPHCRQSPGDRELPGLAGDPEGGESPAPGGPPLRHGGTELSAATGGCTATVYQFPDGSVGYFAPEAPMWREAGEVTGQDLESRPESPGLEVELRQ